MGGDESGARDDEVVNDRHGRANCTGGESDPGLAPISPTIPPANGSAVLGISPTPAGDTTSQRSLGMDSLLTAVSKVLVGLMNFGAAVVVAREFGPTGRGAVAVGLTLVLILMQVGNIGLTAANSYFAARHPSQVRSLVANTVIWSAVAGGLLGSCLLLFRALIPQAIGGTSFQLVTVAAAAVPAALAAVLLQSLLLGQGRTLAYNGVEAACAVGAVTALIIAGAAIRPSPTVAMAILLGQYPTASLVYLFLLSHGVNRPKLDGVLARQTLRFGARVYLATVLSFLVVRLDLILVNGILGRAQAGLYSVAAVIAQGLIVVPYAIGTNLFARAARGIQTGYTATVFRSVAVLYGAVCLLMVPLAWPLVHWLYGARFDASFPMVLWLLPGTYAFGMVTILSLHFAAQGYPLTATWIWAGGVILNVGLNLVLLPLFGTVMASITSTITYVMMLIFHMRLFSRIDPPAPSLRPSVRETVRLIRGRVRSRVPPR